MTTPEGSAGKTPSARARAVTFIFDIISTQQGNANFARNLRHFSQGWANEIVHWPNETNPETSEDRRVDRDARRRARLAEFDANDPQPLPALHAALQRMEALGIQRVYCGEGLVGSGRHPKEVCALIEQRGIPTIYGNYDYAIGRDLENCGCAHVDQHERKLGQQPGGLDARAHLATSTFT